MEWRHTKSILNIGTRSIYRALNLEACTYNILFKEGWLGARIGVDIEANLKRPAPDENRIPVTLSVRIPVTLSVGSHFADPSI
jgi:hypothetical protein